MTARISPVIQLFVVAGTALVLLTGCGSGGPEVGAAESAQEEGDYESALASLEEALERDSANVQAYRAKAAVLREMADSSMAPAEYADLYRRAQAAEDSIIAYRPRREGNIQAHRLELFRREMDRGERAYNRANKYEDEELYRRSISFFGAAGILQPDSARPVLNEAFARMRVGQRSEAIPVFVEYVERADTMALDAAKILGKLYYSSGEYEKAAEFLDQATLVHPDDQKLHTLRLKAYNQSGDVEKALLAYREQIERQPERPAYRSNYGALLLKAARYADAIRELAKAVELRPNHVESQYNLGAAYLNAALARDDSLTTLQERMEAEEEGLNEDAEESELTPAQQLDRLQRRRQTLFRKAVPPLERARKMTSELQTRQDACRALLVAYVQTQRPNKAAQVEPCTGLTSADRE